METPSPSAAPRAGLAARLRARLGGSSEGSLTNRLAGMVFLIRVASAALAYLAQVLLARWMGGSDYGVYVYVWTWVLLIGSMADFGTAVSAQKFIPEYRAGGEHALLRGFLARSRQMTFGVSTVITLLLAALIHLLTPHLDPATVTPLYVGCLIVPAFVVANTQDGIARSYDWMTLGLMPQFIVRQSLIIGFTAGAFALGFRLDATLAMLASLAAVWIAMLGQMARFGAGGSRRGSIGGWRRRSHPGRRLTTIAAGSPPRCRSCWSRASTCCCPTPTCWCFSNSAPPRRSASISPW